MDSVFDHNASATDRVDFNLEMNVPFPELSGFES